jgi:hypothetical protein
MCVCVCVCVCVSLDEVLITSNHCTYETTLCRLTRKLVLNVIRIYIGMSGSVQWRNEGGAMN